jgi:hypothetical protein
MGEIAVYDADGRPWTMEGLKSVYGNFIIQAAAAGPGPVWKISALREKKNTYAAMVVRAADDAGNLLDNVKVAWYWPDADQDPNAGPMGGVLPQMNADRAVSGPTNVNGDVGFGMGGGAYYWPSQGQIGPHAVWIYGSATRSELILGLGMVAATNHDHFDVEFTRYDEDPTPPPNGECDLTPVLDAIADLTADVAALQADVDMIKARLSGPWQVTAESV